MYFSFSSNICTGEWTVEFYKGCHDPVVLISMTLYFLVYFPYKLMHLNML